MRSYEAMFWYLHRRLIDTSAATRRLRREALLASIAERGYDRVSVQDVLDHADLAGATFSTTSKKADLLLSGWKELEQASREAMASHARRDGLSGN